MRAKPLRILGVDPGSRLTGYGCVEVVGRSVRLISHGTLRLEKTEMKSRLLALHQGLNAVILENRPTTLAVENVFFAKNALSALKLGQARGVVVLTAAMHGLDLFEYSATEVKRAITGYGQAEKKQVARMLQMIFGQQGFETWDASDGVALALYHAQHCLDYGKSNTAVPERVSGGKRRGKNCTLADAVAHRVPKSRA